MKKIYIFLIVLMLGVNVFCEIDPVNIYINFPDSPVKIISYLATYSPETKYSNEWIVHKTEVQNVSNQDIVAYQMLFVSFDYFNNYLDKITGFSKTTIQSNEKHSGVWRSYSYGSFTFLTGVAFVNKVRFADGKIWVANENQILTELKKIEKSFDISILKEKDNNKEKK